MIRLSQKKADIISSTAVCMNGTSSDPLYFFKKENISLENLYEIQEYLYTKKNYYSYGRKENKSIDSNYRNYNRKHDHVTIIIDYIRSNNLEDTL